MSILIDHRKCIRCGACAEVCPGNLIRLREGLGACIRHPEECWGCASCLKECRTGAIAYFLGADIGGCGSLMRTVREGPLTHWVITGPEMDTVTITVDGRDSNKY